MVACLHTRQVAEKHLNIVSQFQRGNFSHKS